MNNNNNEKKILIIGEDSLQSNFLIENNYLINYSSVKEFKYIPKGYELLILNHREGIFFDIENIKDIPFIFTSDKAEVIAYAIEVGIENYIFRDEKNTYLKILKSLIDKKITVKSNIDIVNDMSIDEILRLSIENSPLIISYIDNDGIVKMVKGKGLEKLNIVEKDLIDKPVFNFFNSEQVHNIFNQLVSGGSFNGVVEINNTSFESWASPLIKDGENLGMISICTELSTLLKTEIELQESQKRYKSLIENAPIGISTADINGRISDVNPMLLNILGSPSIDATKKINILEFPALVNSGFSDDFLLCLKTQKLIISEIPYESKWGKKIYIRYHLNCIYDNKKNIIGVQAIIEDITDRKNVELALRENEELYRTLASNLPNSAVMLFDKELKYKLIEINTEGLGNVEDYEDKTVEEAIPDQSIKAYYIDALKGEKIIFQKKYADKEFLINILPVKNDLDEIFAGMVLFQDITEQKKSQYKVEASLKEKELLLKEIHHRVKNNLQIISSLLNLQSSYIDDKKTLDIFRDSQNRVKSMALIHEELYRTPNLSKIHFKQYVENLVAHLYQSYRYTSKSLEIIVNSDEVFLDIETAIPLGLIINELVSNSLKYAFRDREKGKILIELITEGEFYTLILSDDGVGLPQNINFSNQTTLGLQIVLSLIEQIDAILDVENSNGVKFIIKFQELKYRARF